MAQSPLDLIITEIAKVLNITVDEVKSKFTDDELNDLLNNSLCSQVDQAGIPIDSINDVPCDDLAIPDLISEIEPDLDFIAPDLPSLKCVESVRDINQQIEKQITEYNRHKILYEKLLEFKDNFEPLAAYYEEKAKIYAELTNTYEPLVIKLDQLKNERDGLIKKRGELNSEIAENALNISLVQSLISQRSQVVSDINSLDRKIRDQRNLIDNSRRELKTSLYPNASSGDIAFNSLISLLGSAESYENLDSTSLNARRSYLNTLITVIFGSNSSGIIQETNNALRNYSEGLSISLSEVSSGDISYFVNQDRLNYRIRFLNLTSIDLEKEIFNQETGERSIITEKFPIRSSELLANREFFIDSDNTNYSLSDLVIGDRKPTGTLYSQFYNLLDDPVNNFFSLSERGLTEDLNLIDPVLIGTGSERKREGTKEYFINDVKRLQSFYETFEIKFEERKKQKREQVINPAKELVSIGLKSIARKEAQLIFLLSQTDTKTRKTSETLNNTFLQITEFTSNFANKAKSLSSELTRLEEKLAELKPNPEKIKKTLKEASPECFNDIDKNTDACPDVNETLGSDPLFTKTLSGCDPTLPTQNQHCYWKEFSKIANGLGLTPIPNGIPTQLRYWPVGLIIPTPVKLIKIPLPIVWIPLITISSSVGNFVFFLTVNGIFISPVVFFVSPSGFKQHILTVKGPSDKFGADGDQSSIKRSIQVPLIVAAAQEVVTNSLSQIEQEALDRQTTILNRSEQIATEYNNENRLKKIKREKNNISRATRKIGILGELSEALNKGDSVEDFIDDLRHTIRKKINDLGRPQLSSINRLKDRAIKRREKILSDTQRALQNNNTVAAAALRQSSKLDGIELSEKITALEQDLIAYFNKIDLPTIYIPKRTASLDPKQNPILAFLDNIREISNLFGTQFLSKDDSKVRMIFLKELAKNKSKILTNIQSKLDSIGSLDLEKDIDTAKSILKDSTKELVRAASGISDGSSQEVQAKINEYRDQLNKEQDTVKRKKIQLKINKAESARLEYFEREKTARALAITQQVFNQLQSYSISFDPFSPCCKSESFSLNLVEPPAIPVFNSAGLLLTSAIDSLSINGIKTIFGGASQVNANDIVAGLIGLINQNIPRNLAIPALPLNITSFIQSHSGILTSLFEQKASIIPAQPALPARVPIDLNLLKDPLASALVLYLKNSIPDFGGSANTGAITGSSSSNSSNNDDSFEIVTCDPDKSQESILSPNESSSERSSTFSAGNVIVKSTKDIHPNFQTLADDILSITPSDLLAILTNFIDVSLDDFEQLISPFYKVLNGVKPLVKTNLSFVEFTQFKAPPTGPPAELAFNAIAAAKKAVPTSALYPIIDTSALSSAASSLETVLSPISENPALPFIVAGAGAADSFIPGFKTPVIANNVLTLKDSKLSKLALREIHPVLVHEDLPPWERLSNKNLLFLLFLDDFIASAADRIGFFRAYV